MSKIFIKGTLKHSKLGAFITLIEILDID